MSDTAVLTIEIPTAIEERLEDMAKAFARSKSLLAREALVAFLDLYEWQGEAILAGIADADAGRLIDHKRVAEWLESWGTDHELPPPRCD